MTPLCQAEWKVLGHVTFQFPPSAECCTATRLGQEGKRMSASSQGAASSALSGKQHELLGFHMHPALNFLLLSQVHPSIHLLGQLSLNLIIYTLYLFMHVCEYNICRAIFQNGINPF